MLSTGTRTRPGSCTTALGQHALVLAAAPAEILVVRQEPAGSRDRDYVGQQAGGDGLRVDRAEGGHVRGGDQWLSQSHLIAMCGTIPWSHGKRALARIAPEPASADRAGR